MTWCVYHISCWYVGQVNSKKHCLFRTALYEVCNISYQINCENRWIATKAVEFLRITICTRPCANFRKSVVFFVISLGYYAFLIDSQEFSRCQFFHWSNVSKISDWLLRFPLRIIISEWNWLRLHHWQAESSREHVPLHSLKAAVRYSSYTSYSSASSCGLTNTCERTLFRGQKQGISRGRSGPP